MTVKDMSWYRTVCWAQCVLHITNVKKTEIPHVIYENDNSDLIMHAIITLVSIK